MSKRKRNSDFRKEHNLTAEIDPDFQAEVTNIYSLPFSCIEYYGSMIKNGPKGFISGCGDGDDEIISGSEDENDKENQQSDSIINLSDIVIISDSEDECDHRKCKRLKKNFCTVLSTKSLNVTVLNNDLKLTSSPLKEFEVLNTTESEPSFSETFNSELGDFLDSIEKENEEQKREIVVRRRGLGPCQVMTKYQIYLELKKLLPIKIRYVQRSKRIVEPLVYHVFENVIFKTVKIFGTIVGNVRKMNKEQIGFSVLDGTDVITCYYAMDDRLKDWKKVPKEYELVKSRTELYRMKHFQSNEESEVLLNMGVALVNTIEDQRKNKIVDDEQFETHTCVSVIGNVSEFYDEKVIYIHNIEKVSEDKKFAYKESFDKLVREIFAKSSE